MDILLKIITEHAPYSYISILIFVILMMCWIHYSISWDTDEVVIEKKPVEEEEDEDDYPANWDDYITCSVPGQEVVRLKPDEYSSYNEDYEGIWSVTLRDGNCTLLPMQYTTIIYKSYFLNKQT